MTNTSNCIWSRESKIIQRSRQMGRKGRELVAHPQCGIGGRDVPLWHPATKGWLKTCCKEASAPLHWTGRQKDGVGKKKERQKKKKKKKIWTVGYCTDVCGTCHLPTILGGTSTGPPASDHASALGGRLHPKVACTCTGGSRRTYPRGHVLP